MALKYPLVSVIIVTFNSIDYINKCLESLYKVNYTFVEIIIVDNKSTDKTREYLKKNQKKVKIIFSDHNLGYAGGNNLGIKNSKGKYIFILNPDTVVNQNFLKPLIKKMEDNKEIAACQPLVFFLNNKHKINLTGKVTHYCGFDWIDNYQSKDVPDSKEITSFSGSGVLIRRIVLDRVGYFDENYFMYYEDTDLSWRIKLAGYKIYYVKKSIIYHDYKYIPKESYQSLKRKIYFVERNRLLTILKNYSIQSLILILPMLCFIEFGMLVLSIIQGWFKYKINSYISILKLIPDIMKYRSSIREIRVLNDKQIIKNFVSEITFEEYNNLVVRFVINPILAIYWSFIKNFI